MTKILLSTIAATMLCLALQATAEAAPISAPAPVKISHTMAQDARWVRRCHRWRGHHHWHHSCHRVHF
jgi:hypothetical protein